MTIRHPTRFRIAALLPGEARHAPGPEDREAQVQRLQRSRSSISTIVSPARVLRRRRLPGRVANPKPPYGRLERSGSRKFPAPALPNFLHCGGAPLSVSRLERSQKHHEVAADGDDDDPRRARA